MINQFRKYLRILKSLFEQENLKMLNEWKHTDKFITPLFLDRVLNFSNRTTAQGNYNDTYRQYNNYFKGDYECVLIWGWHYLWLWRTLSSRRSSWRISTAPSPLRSDGPCTDNLLYPDTAYLLVWSRKTLQKYVYFYHKTIFRTQFTLN